MKAQYILLTISVKFCYFCIYFASVLLHSMKHRRFSAGTLRFSSDQSAAHAYFLFNVGRNCSATKIALGQLEKMFLNSFAFCDANFVPTTECFQGWENKKKLDETL